MVMVCHHQWDIESPDPAQPIAVGIMGTGYAAKIRATVLGENPQWRVVGLAGRDRDRTQALGTDLGVTAYSPEDLLAQPGLDLVVVTTVNANHGHWVRSALERGLHVVVDYPLCLDLAEAKELMALAQRQRRLLHVEHIELLGGLHQSLKAHLGSIGTPRFVRYGTLSVDRPAPDRWTYRRSQFGFPFMGALSRIHRLTDAFGPVASVSCQAQFWPLPAPGSPPDDRFRTCLCTAQLFFTSGVLATVTYGKGEALWRAERYLDVQGDEGALRFEGDEGTLITAAGETPIAVAGRRGLFAQDSQGVLDLLRHNKPLYVQPQASLYALTVADAARRSAETGQVQVL